MGNKNLEKLLMDAIEKASPRAFASEQLDDTLKETKQRIADSLGNKVLSIGNDDMIKKFNSYTMNNETLNFALWLALYNDSWVFKRCIDKPAQDMVKCGVTIQGLSFDKTTDVYRLLKKYRPQLIELLQWGALFGGAIAVCMFNNLKDEDYKEEISANKIKNSKSMRMYITDRWYGCSADTTHIIDNMESLDYGKPEFYDVTFADGHQLRVHSSYVLRCEGRIAPNLIKNGNLQGWGYAEGAHLLNEIMQDTKLRDSVQSLVDKALLEVIFMSGMRGLFSGTTDAATQTQLEKRLEMVNWGRNFNSLTFLDGTDRYETHGFTGLSGLSEIMEQNMWRLGAGMEMQGVLFGDIKNGMGADSDALKRYNGVIQDRCELLLRPILEKLLYIIYMKEGISEKIEFDFNSLFPELDKKEYMEGIERLTTALDRLLNSGVITTQQYAKSLVNYTKNGTIDFCIEEDDIDKLNETFSEESELFGEENE